MRSCGNGFWTFAIQGSLGRTVAARRGGSSPGVRSHWHLLVLNLALTLGMLATGCRGRRIYPDRGRAGRNARLRRGHVLLVPLILLILPRCDPRGYWVWALFGLSQQSRDPGLSVDFGPFHDPLFAGRAMTGLNLLLFLGAFLAPVPHRRNHRSLADAIGTAATTPRDTGPRSGLVALPHRAHPDLARRYRGGVLRDSPTIRPACSRCA